MEDHDRIKEQLGEADRLYRAIAEYEAYDTGGAYRRTLRRIDRSERRRRIAAFLQRAAAALFIPLLTATAVLGWQYARQGREMAADIPVYSVTSAPGLASQILLPDGTEAWLNAGSSLRYPARFSGGERRVELSGEGYFAVEPDSRRPFKVTVGGEVTVTALGTRFNVSSEAATVEATLESGSIEVSLGGKSVRLRPNEMATVNLATRRLESRSVNAWEKTAWKDGRLLFRNAGMEEVAAKLSKRYNVDIEIASEEALQRRFWASFTTESVTQILDYLKLAAPIEWSYSEPRRLDDYSYARRTIIITGRKEAGGKKSGGR
jgi:ferric-dicitrate binding protein FerR (iron transport regulator)